MPRKSLADDSKKTAAEIKETSLLHSVGVPNLIRVPSYHTRHMRTHIHTRTNHALRKSERGNK